MLNYRLRRLYMDSSYTVTNQKQFCNLEIHLLKHIVVFLKYSQKNCDRMLYGELLQTFH